MNDYFYKENYNFLKYFLNDLSTGKKSEQNQINKYLAIFFFLINQ